MSLMTGRSGQEKELWIGSNALFPFPRPAFVPHCRCRWSSDRPFLCTLQKLTSDLKREAVRLSRGGDSRSPLFTPGPVINSAWHRCLLNAFTVQVGTYGLSLPGLLRKLRGYNRLTYKLSVDKREHLGTKQPTSKTSAQALYKR